ncbi:MAG: ATP-grasp domain-containing protein [Hamadaea sp.]|nr:ATP-grasp domain-containing protein [Hamadaea sp.]
MTASAFLFCADPLASRRVDPHFGEQARAVRDLDGTVVLIDHDALLAGDAVAAVRRVPQGAGPLWYRGWMIPADQYEDLAVALAVRGAGLLTSPADYRRAHELPGWYAVFADVTPRSVWLPWTPGRVPTTAEAARLLGPLGTGPAIAKDYVKSRKHEWAEACYIPDSGDVAHATRVLAAMVALQDDYLQGGLVVRAYEDFGAADGDGVGAEARVWWVGGRPVLVSAHPDTPGAAPSPDLTQIAPLVRRLGCPFVTTDVALRADGVWRVVEVGDGQVSDLPDGIDPAGLIAALAEWA